MLEKVVLSCEPSFLTTVMMTMTTEISASRTGHVQAYE